MKTSRLPIQALLKGLLVLVPMMLAFQSIGVNALTSPRTMPSDMLQGGNPPTLTCTSPSTPSYCNVQVVLLIDDSGSMRINDPQANRKKAAMHLMDALATRYYRLAAKAKNDNSALPNVQVAVIHFSNRAISNSGWFQIRPSSRAEWEAQRTSLFGMIDRREEIHEVDGTLFEEAFSAAADLFRSGDPEAAQGPCERRSILLFSDGTPEDLRHGIFQGNDLDAEMAKVTSIVQTQIPGLDGIYVTAFKFNARYWSKSIEEHWLKVVGSPSQYELPPVMAIDGKDYFVPLTRRMDEIAASLSEVKPDQAIADLSRYKGLRVELEEQPAQARQGEPSHIRFKLLNDSGSVVASSDGATPSLKLNVTVAQMVQDNPLNLTQDGDNYQVSWTPASLGDNQFKVVANLTDANGTVFLNCSGTLNVPIEAPPAPNPNPIVLSLLIGSPRFPDHETVTLPLQLNYKGTAAQIDSLNWNHSATDIRSGRSLKTTVKPNTMQSGEYELTVESIGNASTIHVVVSMAAAIDNQTVTVPEATTMVAIPVACACDATSAFWFWPLAILLTGFLVLLLALRIRPEWTEITVEGETRYIMRNNEWQLLFLPFSVLLVLLVVNRLWWCCILPPWLFLALALLPIVFWILTNPWYKRRNLLIERNRILPPVRPVPLKWVVGGADEPGEELSLELNPTDNKSAPEPAPSRPIVELRTAPLKWTLTDEEEVKLSQQS